MRRRKALTLGIGLGVVIATSSTFIETYDRDWWESVKDLDSEQNRAITDLHRDLLELKQDDLLVTTDDIFAVEEHCRGKRGLTCLVDRDGNAEPLAPWRWWSETRTLFDHHARVIHPADPDYDQIVIGNYYF